MNRKLPPEAFDHYVSLGVRRSYQAVADKFGVSKVSVTARALRDDWQERIEAIEAKAREASDKKAVESIVAIRERHAKLGKLLQSRGAEAMVRVRIEKPADAMRAIEVGIEQELNAMDPARSRGRDAPEAQAQHAFSVAQQIREFLKLANETVPAPPDDAS